MSRAANPHLWGVAGVLASSASAVAGSAYSKTGMSDDFQMTAIPRFYFTPMTPV